MCPHPALSQSEREKDERQPARRAGPTLALQMWGATAGRAPGATGFFGPSGLRMTQDF